MTPCHRRSPNPYVFYNSRRLEAIGYSVSIALLNGLIHPNHDILLVCPQYSLYVTIHDQQPDQTVPDPFAKGVYVDQAIALVHSSLPDSTKSFADALKAAHVSNDVHFWRNRPSRPLFCVTRPSSGRARPNRDTSHPPLLLPPIFSSKHCRTSCYHRAVAERLRECDSYQLFLFAESMEGDRERFSVLEHDDLKRGAVLLPKGTKEEKAAAKRKWQDDQNTLKIERDNARRDERVRTAQSAARS
ncbi:hypothetical protein C8J57DRAFT_1507891 [Mycena rebaudengoi]|nr:hypothetical protein C8J57DRAFT_1507891 [Mycena rebaudengoi]